MENLNQKVDICCPPFEPSIWDDKTHHWDEKKFIKERLFTVFGKPMDFSNVMTDLSKTIEKYQAQKVDEMCLMEDISKWYMDLFLAVDKVIPNMDNVKMSGKFYTRVYEGNLKQKEIWREEVQKYLAEKELHIEKWFTWPTTCPKCAKKYGKNYVVIMAKIKE